MAFASTAFLKDTDMTDRPYTARTRWGAIIGSIGGNALEWYDFTIFSYMIPIISTLFFPKSSGSVSAILMSTALFGVGFFTRPLGGICLGLYADRRSRQEAMTLGMGLMAIAVALITCAPTYEQAGITGAIMIAVARLLQGFSVGGEFATSTTFLVEIAPPGRRGFFGSWQITGQIIAQVLGGSVGYLMTTWCTPEQVHAWAWRLPFAFGLFIIPLILTIRLKMSGAAASKRQPEHTSGMIKSLKTQWREILTGMGLVTASTVSFYIIYGYVVTYATKILHLSLTGSYLVQMSAAASMLIVVPFSGYLSDFLNKKLIIFVSLATYLVILWPLYAWLVAAPSITRLIIMQVSLSFVSGMFLGSYCTLITQILSPASRTTMLAIVNNMVVLVVGGFSQLIVTWLISISGKAMAPAIFVMSGVAIGLIAATYLLLSTISEKLPEKIS